MESWRESLLRADRKLVLGACLALGLLAFSGLLTIHNARVLIDTTKQVTTIHGIIAAEHELFSRLHEAENGLFGYIITGSPSFLAAYQSATNQVQGLIDTVRHDNADHTDALEMLVELEGLIQQRLAMMDNRIVVRRADGLEAAAALVGNGEALRVMNEIRTWIGTLVQHENLRLADMEQRADRNAAMTVAVDIVFGALSIGLLGIICALLLRENFTRTRREEDLRRAGHELEMRVAERTADLARINASLQIEIEEHKRAEERLRASEQKLAEAALALEEKNRELEMLVYVTSHDLRSPLLNIRGFANELVRTCHELQELAARNNGVVAPAALAGLLEEIPEATGFINAGVTRMDTLLSGFLRLSRLGREAIRIARLDMNALVASVAKSFDFQLREMAGVIHVDRLPRCLGDTAQLTQVFSNLIDNAMKYREAGRALEIRVTAEERDGMVAYHVDDNGLGITPDQQPRVFEMFHRVNPSVCEGEGMGLAIARRSLDRQNGRITVVSEVGRGSTFTVWLPVAERRPAGEGSRERETFPAKC